MHEPESEMRKGGNEKKGNCCMIEEHKAQGKGNKTDFKEVPEVLVEVAVVLGDQNPPREVQRRAAPCDMRQTPVKMRMSHETRCCES